MPCNDVTENIEIVLDENDFLVSFKHSKLTCGKKIGLPQFIKTIPSLPAEQLATFDFFSLIEATTLKDEQSLFLFSKQAFSLQAILQAYLGMPIANAPYKVVMDDIIFEPQQTILRAIISAIPVDTSKIKACGAGCR